MLKWPVSLKSCFFICFFVNGPQVLSVNTGFLKCIYKWISGMNWSPANKNLIVIAFIFNIIRTKYQPKLLFCLKKFPIGSTIYFLPLQTVLFDKNITFRVLVLKTIGFLLSVFCLQYMTFFYNFNRFYTLILSFKLCLSFSVSKS